MDYKFYVGVLFSSASILAGIIYIARLLINKLFESGLEKYKSSLQKDTDNYKNELNLKTEEFKNGLQILAKEHEIKFSKLYEERGTVIKTVYLSLLNVEKALNEMTTIAQGYEWIKDRSKDNIVRDKLIEFNNIFNYNRLYFSKSICDKIEKIENECWSVLMKWDIHRVKQNSPNKQQLNQQEIQDVVDMWTELDKKVRQEIKLARTELEADFRKLIGVEE